MGEMGNSYTNLFGKPKRKSHFVDQGVDGRMILKWILEKQCPMISIGFIGLWTGSSGGML
jgi:hypothetical protein